MIAVLTINYNLSPFTIDCVNSILKSEQVEYFICLVDNGSKRNDFENLEKKFSKERVVKILRSEKNLGYVGGVNFGLEYCRKIGVDYYVVMNNDTILDPKALYELQKTAQMFKNEAIVSGKVYDYNQKEILQQTGLLFKDKRFLKGYYPGKGEKDNGQYDFIAERDSLDDVFWLIPQNIVKKIGLYSNYYYLYAEQGDYAQMARRNGFKLIYTPGAKIWHKGSMTTGGGNRRALQICFWRGKSGFIFQYRNLKRKYFLISFIRNIFKLSLLAVFAEKNRRKKERAWLRGYLSGFFWLFDKKPDNGYNPYLKSDLT